MKRVLRLLGQTEAAKMDEELMGKEYGFSVDQLMELAGLSVAAAVQDAYPVSSFAGKPTVLVVCGPGNNGGDGLVSARHLHHFGYRVRVFFPKHKDVDIYNRLVLQLEKLDIPFDKELDLSADVVVDAIFGYSFRGSLRAPFDTIIPQLAAAKDAKIVSVDVPSGWEVEEGDVHGTQFSPSVLVSLTAPKKCTKGFQGPHYLGGRFVPDEMAKRYGLDSYPPYQGPSQIVRLQ